MTYRRYPQYKNASHEWLVDLPEDWTIQPLKRIADVRLSNVDKHTLEGQQSVLLCNYVDVYKNERITRQLPFMQATASDEQIKRLTLYKGDVIITKDSESPDDIGVPALVDEELDGVVCGYHLALVRPLDRLVLGTYLHRVIQSSFVSSQFSCAAVGMTRFGLGKDKILNVQVPIPPLSEQKAIISFLDQELAQIDALITKQEQLIAQLHEKHRVLISHAVTKGLDPSVPMKDSGIEWLGDIPTHWELLPTKHLFRLVTDSAPSNNDYELLSLYTDIGVRPRKELEERGNKASTTDGYWLVQKGDIIVNKLLAWMGAIGISQYDGVTSPAYDILRAVRPLNPQFYDYLFRCGICLTEFKRYSRGIMDMRLRLYFSELGQIKLVLPPVEEQDEIVSFLKNETARFDCLVEKAKQMIAVLQERRSALINAAVTGQIDVRTKR